MILELDRFCYGPMGAFGLLRAGELELATVEAPWRMNLPNISCIPEGRYKLRPTIYYGGTKHGRYPTLEVVGVPNDRTGIKFHIANEASELEGCIAPGTGFGCIFSRRLGRSVWSVLNSAVAFRQFSNVVNVRDEHELVIAFRPYPAELIGSGRAVEVRHEDV